MAKHDPYQLTTNELPHHQTSPYDAHYNIIKATDKAWWQGTIIGFIVGVIFTLGAAILIG